MSGISFRKPFLLLVSCVITVGSLSAYAVLTARQARKLAPNFKLTDSNGDEVRLDRYRGHVVLLDFWATWCHGCKTEIPWYVEFQQKYKERGLAVIGVSMDDDGWKSVRPYLKDHEINYPIVIGNEQLAKEYEVGNMPVTLLIDESGRIAEAHAGVVDKDAFEKDISELISDVKH